MYATLVACLNEQLHICVHERNRHCYRRPIWQDEVRVLTELLDYTEDVIPTATIEPSAVVAKLINYLHAISMYQSTRGARFTSSISNAAIMVSIRTVPRMVPRGIAI